MQARAMQIPPDSLMDWAASKLAEHGPSFVTGALGGLVATFRRDGRKYSMGALILVGGITGPAVGALVRSCGASAPMVDSINFVAGVFAFRLLDIAADLIDRAGRIAARRVDGMGGGMGAE